MAKKKPQMRISYCKKRDEYQLLVRSNENEEWGLQLGCKCVNSKHDNQDDEKEFVHCNIIEELKRNLLLGYELLY